MEIIRDAYRIASARFHVTLDYRGLMVESIGIIYTAREEYYTRRLCAAVARKKLDTRVNVTATLVSHKNDMTIRARVFRSTAVVLYRSILFFFFVSSAWLLAARKL